METTTTEKTMIVLDSDTMDEIYFGHVIRDTPAAKSEMSFDNWCKREQVRLLKSINDKLTFFMVLVILAILAGLFLR